eukprot:jgi/Mesen1/5629/ME000282S04767
MEEYRLEFHGVSRGNPGWASAGAVLRSSYGTVDYNGHATHLANQGVFMRETRLELLVSHAQASLPWKSTSESRSESDSSSNSDSDSDSNSDSNSDG